MEGERKVGRMKSGRIRLLSTLFALVFSFSVSAQVRGSGDDRFAGSWEGKLDLGGSTLRLGFAITKNGDGSFGATMDSPDQGAFGIPGSRVVISGDSIRIEVAAAGGHFTGSYEDESAGIKGAWTQSGMDFPLILAKVEPVEGKAAMPTPDRPQTPVPPFPYEVRDCSFQGGAPDARLAATLTLPEGGGPFPAAILVTGSGPQDRDETIMNHKPFLVIADFLARRGIATLRYDDRGMARSTGNFPSATTLDFAADASAALRFLRTLPGIDPGRVGVIGHSEGGLIAAILAADGDLRPAFAVMLAGPALDGTGILLTQSQAIARAEGADEAAIEQVLATNSKLYGIAAGGATDEEARAAIIAALMETVPFAPQEEAFRAGLEAQLGGAADALLTPWMRNFLRLDPEPYMKEVRIPLLALYGTSDLQVVASANAPAARRIFESSGAELASVVVLPDLNHLFQTSATGRIGEYGELTETISPVALDVLGSWLSLAAAKFE